MIRITGGSLRGRVLPAAVPAGVRPTAGRVREAVFSMLGQRLDGWSMLDLFGGSGLMAIEAASRGAAPVTVVDRSAKSVACIRANAQALGAELRVVFGEASARMEPADLVYLDPPYRDPILPWLERAAACCRRVIVAEARAGVDWPEALPGFVLDRARTYGDSSVALYVRSGAAAGGPEDAVVGDDRGVIEHDGGGERVEGEPPGLPGVVPAGGLTRGRGGGEHDR
jgi:16S rRNA (guanine(966)-N(2))-methyltransferase RsmD